jgi:hypothetical protein
MRIAPSGLVIDDPVALAEAEAISTRGAEGESSEALRECQCVAPAADPQQAGGDLIHW